MLQLNAMAFAQNRITLSRKNAPLEKILNEIKMQSGYDIFFIRKDLKLARPVNIEVKEASLEDALKQVFANQSLEYTITAKTVVIQEKKAVVEKPSAVKANINITGKVVDEKGEGIPGATIKVKGTAQGGITDANGQFKLVNIDEKAILVVSYLGYITQEVNAGSGAPLIIRMAVQASNLNEVVVVAYGTQKKSSLTGAIATISPKKLRETPVSSLQNALQGVSPGLTILQRPGDVSRASDGTSSGTGGVSIRGRSSLASAGSPMYVIDGIPAIAQEFASLNPNDIASISVLKDASSAALYGSRAANGVIMVTTRRGGGDRTIVELNADYGFQSATRLPKYVGSVDYANLYNEALTNAGGKPIFTPAQIQAYQDGSQPDLYPNTNWYKEVLRKTAPESNISLNINSPGKTTSSYLGLNYLSQASLIPNKNQKRVGGKLNTESTIVPGILKVGTNLSFTSQNFDRKGDLSWTELNRSLPTSVLRQSNGEWGSIDNGVVNANTAGRNQLRAIQEGGWGWDRDNYLQTAANATLTPLKGLTVNTLASFKFTDGNSTAFNNTTTPINNFLTGVAIPSTANTVNDMKEYYRKRRELLVQGTVDYERSFGKHYGKITIGGSQESNVYRTAFLGRKNFPNNDMTTVGSGSSNPEDINSDADGQANTSGQVEWAMRSVFGRFNYAFNDKYLFEVNTRIDYSSRFSPDIRKAVFPSFSAGWNISKESFMKDVNWVSNLKLRGSYGSLGNQDVVAPGNYYNLLNTGYAYSFEGVPQGGVWQNNIPNYSTTWEKVYMTDLGVDMSLFKGKLDITADYYVKDTKDLLLRVSTLSTIGVNTSTTSTSSGLPYVNGASTRNKGFELALTHNNKIGNDFTYSVGANFSVIKNKITQLGDGRDNFDGTYIQRVGESIGSFYGYQAEGLFVDAADVKNHAFQSSATGPGDIKYKDLNGDGKIDASDRKVLGNDVPWFNYGFNISASYKGFDFSVITYGVANVKTYLNNEAAYPFFNGANVKEQWLNRWTTANPNPNADFPRILTTAAGGQNYTPVSSFWLFNGAYFRVRGITLGYTIPQQVSKKFGMSRLRIYSTTNNPFTIMADKRLADYDPESASGRGGYPGIKTLSFGINASF
ncbi:TonB-dependent receptor [Pedobacter cryoconitis]|uniref:TonB-linked SusC/RagA family outer membrane protein n=1 Tax=Pedobacter cryoconitis TaxID=188932 RepID=A0A7X0J6N8_9SPHI|nr:TonB-dependent receptor [Pedobacter cryoconitis]MBB6501938.1 TonB-linked SusC/RagA family outer membrane protein [Pedobacter cryoconitis]